MKKFTKAWIKKWSPCSEAVRWFYDQRERDVILVLKKLMKEGKYDWANWAIVRCMRRKQYLRYAIYAAKQVLGIYEKENPNDKRPREAIRAAKKVLVRDTKQNRDAAYATAYAADAAAHTAADAAYAAHTAADAAYAADAAAYAAAERTKMQKRILNYGISLIICGNQAD